MRIIAGVLFLLVQHATAQTADTASTILNNLTDVNPAFSISADWGLFEDYQ
jgi:hypothetical protein